MSNRELIDILSTYPDDYILTVTKEYRSSHCLLYKDAITIESHPKFSSDVEFKEVGEYDEDLDNVTFKSKFINLGNF